MYAHIWDVCRRAPIFRRPAESGSASAHRERFMGVKKAQADFNEMLAGGARQHVPVKTTLELTYRCNLRCVHCPVSETAVELPASGWKKILDEAEEVGAAIICFSGGEPLMRDDFFEVASHARRLHFSIQIKTNGTLVDEEKAAAIADLLPTSVEINIFGGDAETHERITRVPGSFAATLESVRLLAERGVEVSVKSIIMKSNFNGMRAIIDLVETLGVEFHVDPTFPPRVDGSLDNLSERLSGKQLREFMATPEIAERYHQRECLTPWCQVGTSEISVAPTGDVFPCTHWRKNLGNIKTRPLGKIWADSPVLKTLRDITRKNVPACRECDVVEWCTRCPGRAEIESGAWNQPYEWACERARAMRDSKQTREGKDK